MGLFTEGWHDHFPQNLIGLSLGPIRFRYFGLPAAIFHDVLLLFNYRGSVLTGPNLNSGLSMDEFYTWPPSALAWCIRGQGAHWTRRVWTGGSPKTGSPLPALRSKWRRMLVLWALHDDQLPGTGAADGVIWMAFGGRNSIDLWNIYGISVVYGKIYWTSMGYLGKL